MTLASCGNGDIAVGGGTATPPTSLQSIGGTVSGLTGSGLVLQDNGGDDLAVSANGSFVFASQVAGGAAYFVTVKTQPGAPRQTCTVTNSSGTVGSSAVGDVAVTCVAVTPRFAFFSDAGGNDLKAFSVDSSTGSLAEVDSLNNGAASYSLALTPGGKFLYVANRTPNTITGYAVNPVTAALSPIAGSPFAVASLAPRVLAITPDGKFLYTATQSGNTIEAFAIDSSTGALSAVGTPVATGGQPLYINITPNGKYLYVASFNNRSMYGYAIDATTGALTPVPGSPFAVYDLSTYARSSTIDPRGKFLYVPTYTTSVAGFTIDDATGTLTMMAGSPFATGAAQASFAAVDGTGKYLYVTNENSNNISAYAINQTTGVLSALPGSPFANGHSPQEISADPGGRFLFVSNQSSSEMNVYTIDPATGLLTLASGSPFSTTTLSPGGIAIWSQ